MESQVFQIEIISPSQTQVITIEWVEVESPTGSFFVGPDHAPLVSIIKNQSTLRYKKPHEEEKSIDIRSGIFSVNKNKAVALIDQ
jgi:F0F1-type ATP synthase epsilon subunit